MKQPTIQDFLGEEEESGMIIEAANEVEEIWNPVVDLRDDTDQTTSSLSAADGSGKVNLTYVCNLSVGAGKESEILNYISEAQTIRRKTANVFQSFQDDDKKPQNGAYGIIKSEPFFVKSALISNNKLVNVNKVGEAFASWISNGHDKEKPKYGNKDYIVVDGSYIDFDLEKEVVSIRLGGSSKKEVVDKNRSEWFHLPMNIGDYQRKAIHASEKGNVNKARSEIHYRDNQWFLHFTISYKQPVYDWKDITKWIGVDLGTVSLYSGAVVESTDDSLHDNGIDVLGTINGPGEALMHERRRAENSLQYLQREYGYDVASEKLGHKLSLQSIQLEHEYANEIVRKAKDNEPCGIVLEDLIGIKGLGWSNLWAYFRFKQVITYKAHQEGIPVLTLGKLETKYTSQDCSSCGKRPENGRISRSQFQCSECGYGPVDADTNAAINIAKRVIER